MPLSLEVAAFQPFSPAHMPLQSSVHAIRIDLLPISTVYVPVSIYISPRANGTVQFNG